MAPLGSSGWRRWLGYSLGFDTRSLALLRIGLAAIYLLDMLQSLPYLDLLYSDEGFFPRSLLPGLERVHQWSLYLGLGTPSTVAILYGVQMAAVVLLGLGWKTRWMSFWCFLLASSLQARSATIPGYDGEIRLLLLYGTVLPWGEIWSWDARGKAAVPRVLASPATLAWRMQVAILYVGAGLLKGGPYWADGTAVEASLHSDGYATAWAAWLLGRLEPYPDALVVLNDAVPLYEILVPLLLFFPWPSVQVLGALMLVAMHAAFGLCLDIGLFSVVCSICLLGFLPGSWLDLLSRRRQAVPVVWKGGPAPVAAALTFCIVWSWLSLWNLLPEGKDTFSERTLTPIQVLGLEQSWGMFVPPPIEGGWHVLKGRTRSGRWVDLLQQRPHSTDDRPEFPHRVYPNVRIYLLCSNHLRGRESVFDIRKTAAHCLRRRWEEAHPSELDRLERVELLYFKRMYRPGEGYGPATRHLLWEEDFF